MKFKNKKDIQDVTPHEKFGWRGTTGRGSAKIANLSLPKGVFFLWENNDDIIHAAIVDVSATVKMEHYV